MWLHYSRFFCRTIFLQYYTISGIILMIIITITPEKVYFKESIISDNR